MFRQAPAAESSPDEPKANENDRYLQTLSLSHHPSKSYVAITDAHTNTQTRAGAPATSGLGNDGVNNDPATVVSIPSGLQSEDFIQLMTIKFSLLWTPRQVLFISNGQCFKIGDFQIRFGELRHGHGQGQGGMQHVRGVAVEIEWMESGEEDWEIVERTIGGFWEALDVQGAKLLIRIAGVEEGDAVVRQWCEVLKLRT